MKTNGPPFADPRVAAVFGAYDETVRGPLLALRALILDEAAATPSAGRVIETLKWGQPSYLDPRPRAGTTVRIDAVKGRPGAYALYVHCQTDLADRFRALHGDELTVEGDRAVVFDASRPLPEAAVRSAVRMALTYRGRGDFAESA